MNKPIQANERPLCILKKIVPSDLETPVSAFLKLRKFFPKKPAFLLESVEKGEQVGRYSILGFEGDKFLRWFLGDPQNPLSLLSELLKGIQERFSSPPSFPLGSLGYLSYDAVRTFEKLAPPKGPSPFPDAYFVIPYRMVLFDHVRNTMTLFAVEQEQKCARALENLEQALLSSAKVQNKKTKSSSQFVAIESQKSFMEKVMKAKEYIKQGEIFQVVLSQKITGKTSALPIDIYRALRILNPSPYMVYLDFNSFKLIGSSPEMLVKVQDKKAQTRPIAGTRPRGKTAQEDEALARELNQDPKERAEHTMLVDLGRNDLGRVCDFGSVKATKLLDIERYSHVMHMVSTVEGNMKDGKSALDVLRASFPAGTVTGAPKIRAMEIIDELETCRRGPYAGCMGYVSFSGDLNTCITIRTIVMQGNHVYLQAGAGIVADSDPKSEYEETLKKIEGLKQAIHLAEKNLDMSQLRWSPWQW